MKKYIISLAGVLFLAAIIGIILIALPCRPDGTIDTIELSEVAKYTEVELENRLIGESHGNILVSWGVPDASSDSENGNPEDKYYIADSEKYSSITLYYDVDGVIKRILLQEVQ